MIADFRDQEMGSAQSASVLVPLVYDLIKPKSVIDVGCGTGKWLWVWAGLGVERLAGIEGPWARSSISLPTGARFVEMDLTHPREINETFDLATCLEVAEHLPPEEEDSLIAFLCRLSPLILFGAAVPGQRGKGHLNERWPSHWVRLFAERGYVTVDLRKVTWRLGNMLPWYIQNTLLYIRQDRTNSFPALRHLIVNADEFLDCVHPDMFRFASTMGAVPTKEIAIALLRRIYRKVKRIGSMTESLV